MKQQNTNTSGSNVGSRRQFSQCITGLALSGIALGASAQQLAKPIAGGKAPPELGAFGQATAWQMQGTGALRFFGFKAYDASLWTAGAAKGNPLTDKTLFALEIAYNTGKIGRASCRERVLMPV